MNASLFRNGNRSKLKAIYTVLRPLHMGYLKITYTFKEQSI